MTRSIGRALSAPLLELLDGELLESKTGMAFHCVTSTEDGWPYLSMVSVGELLARGPSDLRIAIWAKSSTDRNLERDARCAIALVHQGVSYVIRCQALLTGTLRQPDGPDLRVFDLTIVDVLEDSAPYATLTSGVTYALHEPTVVLARWERTIHSLRAMP